MKQIIFEVFVNYILPYKFDWFYVILVTHVTNPVIANMLKEQIYVIPQTSLGNHKDIFTIFLYHIKSILKVLFFYILILILEVS